MRADFTIKTSIVICAVFLFSTVLNAQLLSWTTPGTGNTLSGDGMVKTAGAPNTKINGISNGHEQLSSKIPVSW